MLINHIRRVGAGVVLAGGAATFAAMTGMSTAHADDGTVDINGWTVTTSGEETVPNATLTDSGDSLGMGTETSGVWSTTPYTADSAESDDTFATSDTAGSLQPFLTISDTWQNPWLEEATVQTDSGSAHGFLLTGLGGNDVVDLFNQSTGLVNADDAPPLVNPDAAGPVNVGGLDLASPQDGALFNDLYDAIFKGDTADWGKAETLFSDLLGLDPSTIADAGDVDSLPDFGF